MAVEDYNARALRALDAAQRAKGIRSSEAFAGMLSVRVGGSPDGSTYRRWVRGESIIPAWALIAAAEEADLGIDTLIDRSPGGADLADKVEALRRELEDRDELLGLLQAQLIEVRQHVGLPLGESLTPGQGEQQENRKQAQ